MYKKAIVSLLLLWTCQMPGWSASYYDVEYQSGYPEFAEGPQVGALHVEPEGLAFEAKDGQTFLIRYQDMKDHVYHSSTRSKGGRMFGIAGPNPILLASTLGLSLLGNAIYRPRQESEYIYKVRFEGPDHMLHEVVFKLPDQDTQLGLFDEVQSVNRQENYNVLMQGVAPATVMPEMSAEEPPTPPIP